MTVSNTVVKNVYLGNGSTTVFPYTFALNVDDGQYVKVIIANEQGAETVTDNFTIDTDSRNVTYPAVGDPLPTGYKIVLKRTLPNIQELNLESQGPFFAEDIEAELDRQVMMIQQLQESNDRAVKVQASSSTTPDELIDELRQASTDAAAAADSAYNSASTATQNALECYAINKGTDLQVQPLGLEHSCKTWNELTAGNEDVIKVASNLTDIGTVAGISSDIPTVAGVSSDIPTVSSNSVAINKVATNMTDVGICASNAINIVTCANNMVNIQQAASIIAGHNVDSNAHSGLFAPIDSPMFNKRVIITTSGTFTAPVTGWYKVTCIGGGGAGGTQVAGGQGGGGYGGGDTTFGNITARGGGGGGAGWGVWSSSSSSGGGAAGEVIEDTVYLNQNDEITVVVGAGGAISTVTHTPTGWNCGNNATSAYMPGRGAKGAGSGGVESDYGSSFTSAPAGGTGGYNGTPYGGGGGGASMGQRGGEVGWNVGGRGSANGEDGDFNYTRNTYGVGGAGGDGAIIVEYFDATL